MSNLYTLWTGGCQDYASFPQPDEMTHRIIHRGNADFSFLLGADIIEFQGKLFCGWGNSFKDENDCHSMMRQRISADNGKTWSDVMDVSTAPADGISHSHGVYFSFNGSLYAYLPAAPYPDYEMGTIQTIARQWDGNQWTGRKVIAEKPFWPMAGPQRNAKGTYIMPGIIVQHSHAYPAVAQMQGNDPFQWKITDVPVEVTESLWAEGGFLTDGSRLLYVFRNSWNGGAWAYVSESLDGGETWAMAQKSNLVLSHAKPCAFTLKDGRNLLAYNQPSKDAERNVLVLAVSEPGKLSFNKAYALRTGPSHKAIFAGKGKEIQWAYPSIYEYDGMVHVVYTASKEDCVMTSVPVHVL